ncbi:MAG TPA: site-specific DNA-methyltransferase [Thermotogota bacterium]|nr:site-specific DNA-methyltransferase [Thermotogota bacterium]
MSDLLYGTDYGEYYFGKCEDTIPRLHLEGKVQLILTSPPFPLNSKKQYGNLTGNDYLQWFSGLAELFSSVLTPNGSIVIEMGNAWEKGRPVQSLLTINSLLSFVNNEQAGLRLCQEFVCYNPARLPSPAQWVTINRIRTIDSFTHVWWMANSDFPKADNRRVLRPYSIAMKRLLMTGKFNSGKRPSEHVINKRSFLTDNKGSISHNVLEMEQIDDDKELRLPYSMLSISNTKSNDFFTKTCKQRGIVPHPARMPLELASFFIEFLTDEGDIILDPFGGSNTTGFCAEKLKRKWISIEASEDYGKQSKIRFEEPLRKQRIQTEEKQAWD